MALPVFCMHLDISTRHYNLVDTACQPAIMQSVHVLEVSDRVWAGKSDVDWPANYLDLVALDDTVVIITAVYGNDNGSATGTCCPG